MPMVAGEVLEEALVRLAAGCLANRVSADRPAVAAGAVAPVAGEAAGDFSLTLLYEHFCLASATESQT